MEENMNKLLLAFSVATLLYGDCVFGTFSEQFVKNEKQLEEFISIDGINVPIASWTFETSKLKDLKNDAKNRIFERIEKGQRYRNYDYQCCINSLELTDEENESIPLAIRNKAQNEKGLFADDRASWEEISKQIKKRVLVYEYQEGFIVGFYEYGSNFFNNGTKRVCLEGSHYKKLSEKVSVLSQSNDKQLEQQKELLNLQKQKINVLENSLQELNQQLREEREKNRQAALREQQLKSQIEELKQLLELENSGSKPKNIEKTEDKEQNKYANKKQQNKLNVTFGGQDPYAFIKRSSKVLPDGQVQNTKDAELSFFKDRHVQNKNKKTIRH